LRETSKARAGSNYLMDDGPGGFDNRVSRGAGGMLPVNSRWRKGCVASPPPADRCDRAVSIGDETSPETNRKWQQTECVIISRRIPKRGGIIVSEKGPHAGDRNESSRNWAVLNDGGSSNLRLLVPREMMRTSTFTRACGPADSSTVAGPSCKGAEKQLWTCGRPAEK